MKRPDATLKKLHEAVETAFISRKRAVSLLPNGNPANWIFDFRPLLLRSETLNLICELFWERLEAELPFQVGGLETAAIALVAGMIMKAKEKGINIGGFYTRKSRRKDGFQKHIEGEPGNEKIILLDDALNSGKSLMRQIKVLEEAGRSVHAVCVIIRYRDPAFYEELRSRNIKLFSLFTLDDFPQSGGLMGVTKSHPAQPMKTPFTVAWKFESLHPSYFYIRPKSEPVLDDKKVYFGTDNGIMWALNQNDGSVAWSYKTLFGAGKKRMISSPAIHDNLVYFGAYDGNFYALDAGTGKKKWVYREADWIGSSPCIAPDLGLVFVGLEFGLWNKQGGIAALNLKTGEKKWWRHIETLMHSSPAYSKKYSTVLVGSTSGEVYAYEARTGELRWTYKTDGAVRAGFAFDEERGYVCFGSEDRYIYVLNTKTGELVYNIETLEPIYSTPLVSGDRLYFGVLDKRMLCIDLASGAILWEFWAHSRVFSTPVITDGSLYFGSNDGRLYELDPKTGKELGYAQLTERIVNKIAYNPVTKRFFVPTYANEMYCLNKK